MDAYNNCLHSDVLIPSTPVAQIKYQRRPLVNFSSIPTIDSELLSTDAYEIDSLRKALIDRRPKCTCRYLWNYELHGLTNYLRSRTLSEQLLWAGIIAFCIITAIFTTKMVFEEYLERQTATVIQIQQMPHQLLPSLVVCPKNPDSLKYPLVLKDIARRLPHLDRLTIANLISFAIGGAGFHNLEHVLKTFSEAEKRRLNALFRRWKGSRTLEEFFRDLFEKYGYSCTDMFQACFFGYERIPCCDIFRSHYVMLRGRCFRTGRLFQTDPDVFGRLNIYVNQLPSRLVSKTDGMQPHIVVYVTDKHPDVGLFPRYYIGLHEAIFIRVKNKRIVMLPWNSQCSAKLEDKSRATCFMKKWMWQRVLNPLNCTLFYLKEKAVGYKICEPGLVVQHYTNVNNIKLDDDSPRCLPACRRREHSLQLYRSESSVPRALSKLPDFRLELSYVHLERERYEEVITTTLPGFVSQIGGQSGLFVGLSVCSLIQIVLSLTRKTYRRIYGYFLAEL